MNITNISIRRVSTKEKLRAVVSVTFDDSFVVHDIKIISGEDGAFLAMPARKMPDGTYRDIAHPISERSRAILEKAIFGKCREALEHIGGII